LQQRRRSLSSIFRSSAEIFVFSDMKLLITGIAGFVGSSMARYLLAARSGLEIFGIDNLSRRGSENNLALLEQQGCRVVHGDIRCASDLEPLPAMDWVIDCAANPSVLAGLDGGASSLVGHNLIGALNLLEKCRRDSSGFILISSSRVYSIDALNRIPLNETTTRLEFQAGRTAPAGVGQQGTREEFSTAAPVSLYGATKIAAEVMALEYGHAFNLPVRINRCGVMAGAGQFGRADQGIFSYWIHSHRARSPLKFIGYGGTGLQVRDCLHPDDLAQLVLIQIDAGSTADRPSICNVSGGIRNSMSLRELNAWCEDRFGIHQVTSQPENRQFDAPWVVLDSGLAMQEWGWKPQFALQQVLHEIAEHATAHPNWLKHYS
jgi:CDP-paratose 2-epimerase